MHPPELTNLSMSSTAPVTDNTAKVIQLQHPVMIDGITVDKVNLRRPLVRDRLIAEKTQGSDIDKEIRLIANLCDMAPQHIELFDLGDYQKIQECLADFLS